MEYTLADVDLRSHDAVSFTQWMGEQKFIHVIGQLCKACQSPMILGESAHFAGDNVWLRCTNRECNHQRSVRAESFFQGGHIPLVTQMKLVIMFASEATVTSTAKALGLSRQAVTDYFDNCRGEYADALDSVNGYAPIVFSCGGEYEVDECFVERVKTAVGSVTITIMGIFERGTGKVFLQRVPDRSSNSLLPLLWENVPEGSRVYSDAWSAYVNAPWLEHGMSHYYVNHSAGEYAREEEVTFEDGHKEVINIHCNSLEGVWSYLRSRLRYKSRRNVQRIDIVLREIMWRHCGLSLFWPLKCE